MIKKRAKKIVIILVSLLLVVVVVVTGWSHVLKHSCAGVYTHPKFKTKYTEEEHIERITERTKARYAADISQKRLVEFTVEIVYAFYDHDPEYFLVEFEYAVTDESTAEGRYRHFLGYIENDKYYSGLRDYYGEEIRWFCKSPYEKYGHGDEKKYYGGGVFAVKTEEGILQIYNTNVDGTYAYRQRLIPKSEQKKLMKNNYKFVRREY